MSVEVWLTFVLASILLAITPGPSMSLFVANATSYGVRAGVATVIGNALGLSVLVIVATLGLSSVMVFVSEWFEIIRWVGVAYLAYLGLTRLRRAFARPTGIPLDAVQPPNSRSMVRQGCLIALSNPKVLLFLGAFFPQFLDLTVPVTPQLVVLAATFVTTVTLTDLALANAVGRARALLSRNGQRWTDGLSGALLLGGSAVLATIKR